MQLESYAARLELKALTDEGTFEGLASVFNVRDSQDDIVAPGAFARTLREKGAAAIKMLWHHDTFDPIGVWEELRETEAGLFAKGRLALDVQQGAEAHALMKLGALDGLSIGFRTVESSVDEDTRVRTLTDIELFEISPVTFPANEAARIGAVKADVAAITDPRAFERFLCDAGFPRAFSKAVTCHGFVAAQRQCDAEARGDDELAASLRRAAYVLTS